MTDYDERMLKWVAEGEHIVLHARRFWLFRLGGWWADRPWRVRP